MFHRREGGFIDEQDALALGRHGAGQRTADGAGTDNRNVMNLHRLNVPEPAPRAKRLKNHPWETVFLSLEPHGTQLNFEKNSKMLNKRPDNRPLFVRFCFGNSLVIRAAPSIKFA
jgi:hypothetical protein